MGKSDSETEWKRGKKKKDSDEDSADERKEKMKERGNRHKEDRKEGMNKEKGEGKKRMDTEKEEKKEKKDKEKERRKEKMDKDKEEGKERWDKDKERRDKDKEEGDREKLKKKKDKEEKDKYGHKHHEDEKDKHSHPSGFGVNVPSAPVDVYDGKSASHHNISDAPPHPAHPSKSEDVPWFLRGPNVEHNRDQHPQAGSNHPIQSPPPKYSSNPPPRQQSLRAAGEVGRTPSAGGIPPSGYRIPLGPNDEFPPPDRLGQPPLFDFDGTTPIFIGSAIFPNSVHPCRILPSLNPPCRVLFSGGETEHHGRYDLLPVSQHMEWVPTKNGQIPPGRCPIEGGYESNGDKLYHALGFFQGVYVPGKAGEHLVSTLDLFTLREFSIVLISREARLYLLEEAKNTSKRTTVSCE